MEHGVLKVNETAEIEIEASRAFVMVQVQSEKIAFGNAALSASEDLKSALQKVQKIDESIEIETESVSTESGSGLFGKNSSAVYTIKVTVNKLDTLGQVLGICSDGKNISVKSLKWDYDVDEPKLELTKQAMKQAKHKANEMMGVIDYEVVGLRACSDSYSMPQVSEIILNPAGPSDNKPLMLKSVRSKRSSPPPAPSIDIGVEFKSKRKITAMCNVEFLVKEKG
ncbi:MAG: SIMPL domain-containing protein [Anaerolineae bacterium]